MKHLRQFPTLAIAFCLTAFAAQAGIVIDSDMSGQAMGVKTEGSAKTYIQGHKMRIDTTSKGEKTSTIIDLDTQKMTLINHSKRQADVADMKDVAQKVEAIGKGDVQVTLDPTDEKKKIAGLECQKYNIKVTVNAKLVEGQPITAVIDGPVWLAADAPGIKDYEAFYAEAAKKGLFFVDPKLAKSQVGHARAMTEVYRAMAEKGIPCETTLTVKAEGDSFLSAVVNRMIGGRQSMTATKVAEEDLKPDVFSVPAGYQISNR